MEVTCSGSQSNKQQCQGLEPGFLTTESMIIETRWLHALINNHTTEIGPVRHQLPDSFPDIPQNMANVLSRSYLLLRLLSSQVLVSFRDVLFRDHTISGTQSSQKCSHVRGIIEHLSGHQLMDSNRRPKGRKK